VECNVAVEVGKKLNEEIKESIRDDDLSSFTFEETAKEEVQHVAYHG
jgi:hypothetical protein